MPTYLDRDINGSGADTFPGNQVLFLTVRTTTIGPEVRAPSLADPDEVMRLGWFSLGDSIDDGSGAADYWRDPVWINFLNLLWTPTPSTESGTALGLIATRVRWRLSLGTTAHLHVFGV